MFTPFLMAPLETSDAREAMLAHLGDLFSLAQVVTMNADEAIRLVETTYQRALDRSAEAPPPEDVKPWLIALMLDVHGTRTDVDPAEPAAATAGAPAPEPPDDFRRRLTEQFVHQALPAAFATLPPEQRLLLMLCHVQQLTREEAGRIVGLQPDEASHRLEAARTALHEALYDNATEVERHLLSTGLPEDWDRAALNHLAKTELIPLPPTLLSAVRRTPDVAIAAEPPRPPEQPPGAGVPWGRLLSRLTATLLLIMVAGLLGYAFSGLLRKQPETNLLTLSIEQAGPGRIAFQTDDPERAETYVREQMGWRLTIPAITDASLIGADIREIAEGIRVPVFLYQDAATEQVITLVTVNYALLLDQSEGRIRLERDVLRQIEDDGNFDRFDLGEQRVLIWRYRDEIFLAVAANNVADLRERIAFPS